MESAQLKTEREILREASAYLPVSRCGEPHSLRLRVARLRAKRLCRGLKVSRSDYYTWY